MQDNIAEEGPHQVLAPAGVQQRHIHHHDVNTLLLGQNPPLFQNLAVVAAQPVDALDIEQVVRLQLFDQLLVLGPLKILAGLLVQKDILLRDGQLPHGDQLPVLVLVTGADPDIAVCIGNGYRPSLLPERLGTLALHPYWSASFSTRPAMAVPFRTMYDLIWFLVSIFILLQIEIFWCSPVSVLRSLFRMNCSTKSSAGSLFSHGLKTSLDFKADSSAVLPESRSCPPFPAACGPLWCARALWQSRRTSPGDVSHSDGHAVINVHVSARHLKL